MDLNQPASGNIVLRIFAQKLLQFGLCILCIPDPAVEVSDRKRSKSGVSRSRTHIVEQRSDASARSLPHKSFSRRDIGRDLLGILLDRVLKSSQLQIWMTQYALYLREIEIGGEKVGIGRYCRLIVLNRFRKALHKNIRICHLRQGSRVARRGLLCLSELL